MLKVQLFNILSVCVMLILSGCSSHNKNTPSTTLNEPSSSSIIESSQDQNNDVISQPDFEADDSTDPESDNLTVDGTDNSSEIEVNNSTETEEDDSTQANSVLTPTDDTSDSERPRDNEALYQDLRNNHWTRIFPSGRRNVGGPQFFKYIYEELDTDHDFLLSRDDLLRYANHSLTYRIVDRIFQALPPTQQYRNRNAACECLEICGRVDARR